MTNHILPKCRSPKRLSNVQDGERDSSHEQYWCSSSTPVLEYIFRKELMISFDWGKSRMLRLCMKRATTDFDVKLKFPKKSFPNAIERMTSKKGKCFIASVMVKLPQLVSASSKGCRKSSYISF